MVRTIVSGCCLVLAVALVAPAPASAEPHARPRDFRCLLKGKKVEGTNFYIFNRSRARLRKAVAITEAGALPPASYPVNTVLQVLPFEAMIKRRPGYNPGGNDWEFVRLGIDATGKTQYPRGWQGRGGQRPGLLPDVPPETRPDPRPGVRVRDRRQGPRADRRPARRDPGDRPALQEEVAQKRQSTRTRGSGSYAQK